MDLQLTGKAAIVTGGSRGIGKAIARQLGREGVDVAIVARTDPDLEQTARELRAETGRRILKVVADTSKEDSVKAMVRQAAESLGRIDILVNCAAQPAGQGPAPGNLEITDEQFWSDFNTKVLGYYHCAREVVPHMQREGWGRIISISGMAARTSRNALPSMRNVSVVAMTKNLADELGPQGINVTVLHPAMTRTEATPRVIATRAQAQGISLEEAERQMAQANSIRRLIDAREIADVVTFLASPRSIAINGDVIAVGGGVPGLIYY